MKKNAKITLLTLAALYTVISINLQLLEAASTTQIYIYPNEIIGTEYAPGTIFTIAVIVENVSQLQVLSFTIGYDQHIISCRGYMIGNPQKIASAEISIDDSIGLIEVGMSFKEALPSDEATQIINLTYTVQNYGETLINLTVIEMVDWSGSPIPFNALGCYFNSLHPYDLNKDGKVDIRDVAVVAAAFGSFPGHERWNPDADVNGDGIVDILDVTLVASCFGEY